MADTTELTSIIRNLKLDIVERDRELEKNRIEAKAIMTIQNRILRENSELREHKQHTDAHVAELKKSEAEMRQNLSIARAEVGKTLVLRKENTELKARIGDLKQGLEKDEAVASLTADCQRLRQQRNQDAITIEQLNAKIDQAASMIERLNAKINQLNSDIDRLGASVVKKDTMIVDLIAKLTA